MSDYTIHLTKEQYAELRECLDDCQFLDNAITPSPGLVAAVDSAEAGDHA